jgi:hypothetical protein
MKSAVTATNTPGASDAPKRRNFKPYGTTGNKAITKTLANRSAYPIQYVNVVIANIVFKAQFVSHTP